MTDVTKFKTKAPWGNDPFKDVPTQVKSAFTRSALLQAHLQQIPDMVSMAALSLGQPAYDSDEAVPRQGRQQAAGTISRTCQTLPTPSSAHVCINSHQHSTAATGSDARHTAPTSSLVNIVVHGAYNIHHICQGDTWCTCTTAVVCRACHAPPPKRLTRAALRLQEHELDRHAAAHRLHGGAVQAGPQEGRCCGRSCRG